MARHKRTRRTSLTHVGRHRKSGIVSDINLPLTATSATLGVVLLTTLNLSNPEENQSLPAMVPADRVIKASRSETRKPLDDTTVDFPRVTVPIPTATPTPKPKKKVEKTPERIVKRVIPKTPKKTVEPRPVTKKAAPTKTIRIPGLDFSPCADSSGIESGLHHNAINLYRAVCHAIPAAGPFGGYRNEAGSYHQLGRAVDCMVSSHSLGERVKDFVYAHRKELNVMEIIWEQHIWTASRSSEGFRPMSDRGSATANHMDHVHVTLF